MLDKVTPLSYDCGSLCNNACCRGEAFARPDDCYIYLLPGEMEYLKQNGTKLAIERDRAADHLLPGSWGEYVYIARCSGPGSCERSYRPLQCRTFPLLPRIDEDGELKMCLCDIELPYRCPFVEGEEVPSAEFVRTAYEAWSILILDEAVKDLLTFDSYDIKPL